MSGACVIPARTLWSAWNNACGPGAGAGIAALRGRSAGGSYEMRPGEWEGFLAVHPELTGHDFTRHDLLRALKRAIQLPGIDVAPRTAKRFTVEVGHAR